MESYKIVGVMSGTSLDGLDLALCRLSYADGHWQHRLLAARTVPYGDHWRRMLSDVVTADGFEFARIDRHFGHFAGQQVRAFLEDCDQTADAVASHGHTVFHQPSVGVTVQIGHGAALSAAAGLPVVCDFRALDVALGGQGAPLVPLGDALLFPDYAACLNLGGIANISFQRGDERVAYDIGPANQLLNWLANQVGEPYDPQGEIAASGRVDIKLLATLNSLGYYVQPFPKSLGREEVETYFLPLLDNTSVALPDLLATVSEHLAQQIAAAIPQQAQTGTGPHRLLITGGGAFNTFLLSRLEHYLGEGTVPIVPDDGLVKFKEAIIFALLGTLRLRQQVNCLRSVTGARTDHVGGALYGVWPPAHPG